MTLFVESAAWSEDGENILVTTPEGLVLWVPDDMSNRDRQELEIWMRSKGNMIQPYQPPEVPDGVV